MRSLSSARRMVAIFLTVMICILSTNALTPPTGGGRYAPEKDHIADQVNGNIIGEPRHQEAQNKFKWWTPIAKAAGAVKTGLGKVDAKLQSGISAILSAKGQYERRQQEIEEAHGINPISLRVDAGCDMGLQPRTILSEITPDVEFGYCDILESADGLYRAFNTGYGDIKVCSGEKFHDCYTAINGKGWSNWGLTYREILIRNVKYLIPRKQPIRTLAMEKTLVTYSITDVGSWSIGDWEGVYTYGGNGFFKRAFTKAEPHITIVENNELIFKRVSDGEVISKATKTHML